MPCISAGPACSYYFVLPVALLPRTLLEQLSSGSLSPSVTAINDGIVDSLSTVFQQRSLRSLVVGSPFLPLRSDCAAMAPTIPAGYGGSMTFLASAGCAGLLHWKLAPILSAPDLRTHDGKGRQEQVRVPHPQRYMSYIYFN